MSTTKPSPDAATGPVPAGYRQAVVSAITVLLGFSAGFLFFWGFQAEGSWDGRSLLPFGVVFASLCVHLYALFRALDLRDDSGSRYAVTVRWVMLGTLVQFSGFVLAGLVAPFLE